jgi:hypothetical protein
MIVTGTDALRGGVPLKVEIQIKTLSNQIKSKQSYYPLEIHLWCHKTDTCTCVISFAAGHLHRLKKKITAQKHNMISSYKPFQNERT